MLTSDGDASPAHNDYERVTTVGADIESFRSGAQPLCLGGIETYMTFASRTTEGIVGG